MDIPQTAVLKVVQSFVQRKKGPDRTPDFDAPLLQQGYLDSFGLIELIGELEQNLQISLPDGSLIPEDFESVRVLHNRLLEL